MIHINSQPLVHRQWLVGNWVNKSSICKAVNLWEDWQFSELTVVNLGWNELYFMHTCWCSLHATSSVSNTQSSDSSPFSLTQLLVVAQNMSRHSIFPSCTKSFTHCVFNSANVTQSISFQISSSVLSSLDLSVLCLTSYKSTNQC